MQAVTDEEKSPRGVRGFMLNTGDFGPWMVHYHEQTPSRSILRCQSVKTFYYKRPQQGEACLLYSQMLKTVSFLDNIDPLFLPSLNVFGDLNHQGPLQPLGRDILSFVSFKVVCFNFQKHKSFSLFSSRSFLRTDLYI